VSPRPFLVWVPPTFPTRKLGFSTDRLTFPAFLFFFGSSALLFWSLIFMGGFPLYLLFMVRSLASPLDHRPLSCRENPTHGNSSSPPRHHLPFPLLSTAAHPMFPLFVLDPSASASRRIYRHPQERRLHSNTLPSPKRRRFGHLQRQDGK
jgi:hypothetical protein